MRILIVSEKWCDCHPSQGPTNSEHVLWGSLAETGLADVSLLHYDELRMQQLDPDTELVRKCLKDRPDIIVVSWFAVPDSPFNPSLATLKEIRSDLDIPIVSLFWDSIKEENLQLISRIAPCCDYAFCLDSSLSFQRITGAYNVLPFYTPNSSSFFCDEKKARDIRVAFLGSTAGYPERKRYLRVLQESSIDVFLGGGQRENRLHISEYASVLKRCRISLNFTGFAGRDDLFQLKGRIFESLLCNALLIQNHDDETPKLFKPFIDYIPFGSEQDLVRKVNYYLHNDNERQQIARNGHEKALAYYSGKSFWEHLISLLKARRRKTLELRAAPAPRRVYCAHPWYGLTFGAAGHYGPCCFIRYPLGKVPESRADLMALWNSPEMASLRRRLISGDVTETECDRCYDRFFQEDFDITGSTKSLPRYSTSSDPFFDECFRYSDYQYREGRAVLATPPLELYFFGSTRCNLRCSMCGQDHDADQPYPVSAMRRLITDVGVAHFDRIGFIGGEPLLTKDGREFLALMHELGIRGTCIYLTSNATLIDNVWEDLARIDNLFLTVSVDGVGPTYERIRRGASFGSLRSSLHRIATELGDSRLNINSICMKSTLPDLLQLLDLAGELKATIFFSQIAGNEKDENFFENPSLIGDIAAVNAHLTCAMQRAATQRSAKAYHSILVLKVLLNLVYYGGASPSTIRHSDLSRLIMTASENCMRASDFQSAREMLLYLDSLHGFIDTP